MFSVLGGKLWPEAENGSSTRWIEAVEVVERRYLMLRGVLTMEMVKLVLRSSCFAKERNGMRWP